MVNITQYINMNNTIYRNHIESIRQRILITKELYDTKSLYSQIDSDIPENHQKVRNMYKSVHLFIEKVERFIQTITATPKANFEELIRRDLSSSEGNRGLIFVPPFIAAGLNPPYQLPDRYDRKGIGEYKKSLLQSRETMFMEVCEDYSIQGQGNFYFKEMRRIVVSDPNEPSFNKLAIKRVDDCEPFISLEFALSSANLDSLDLPITSLFWDLNGRLTDFTKSFTDSYTKELELRLDHFEELQFKWLSKIGFNELTEKFPKVYRHEIIGWMREHASSHVDEIITPDITWGNSSNENQLNLNQNSKFDRDKESSPQNQRELILLGWMAANGYVRGSKINETRKIVWNELEKYCYEEFSKRDGHPLSQGAIKKFFDAAINNGICRFS